MKKHCTFSTDNNDILFVVNMLDVCIILQFSIKLFLFVFFLCVCVTVSS